MTDVGKKELSFDGRAWRYASRLCWIEDRLAANEGRTVLIARVADRILRDHLRPRDALARITREFRARRHA